MKSEKTMRKINSLGREVEAMSNEIDKKYDILVCKECYLPATHILVRRRIRRFLDYLETPICNECVRYINSLSCYEHDAINYVTLEKLI